MWTTIKDKVFPPLLVALVIAIVVWTANLSAEQNLIKSDHRLWEEKLIQVAEDVKEIKADVKVLREDQPSLRTYPAGLSPAERRTLDQVADAIRRQNCYLAGGEGPACQNIE